MTYLENEKERYCQRRADHRSALVKHQPNALSKAYHQRLTEVYRHVIGECDSILDLGCGNGDLLNSLHPNQGVGVDISEKMIHEAQIRYPEFRFYCVDAQSCDLSTATFDVIIMADLLNDLWDVQATLMHIRQYCNPHTRIIFNIQSHLWEYLLCPTLHDLFARD